MDACQIDDVHPVDRGELSVVIGLEDFFCEGNHLLHGNVEAIADPLEQNVNDMEVNDQNVLIDG